MQGLSLGQINLPEPTGAKLEILGKILGVDAETIRESALNESRGDIKIRVIHPLLCKGCFTKTYARILASGLSALDPLLPEEVTARSSLSTVWRCLETALNDLMQAQLVAA